MKRTRESARVRFYTRTRTGFLSSGATSLGDFNLRSSRNLEGSIPYCDNDGAITSSREFRKWRHCVASRSTCDLISRVLRRSRLYEVILTREQPFDSYNSLPFSPNCARTPFFSLSLSPFVPVPSSPILPSLASISSPYFRARYLEPRVSLFPGNFHSCISFAPTALLRIPSPA